MGFWHTGYMEFHEATGNDGDWEPSPPRPPEFRCPECALVFSTERDRRTHRFDGHSTKRPALVFKGRECGRTRQMVTDCSEPADWRGSDIAAIRLNGKSTTMEEAADFLATTTSGVQTITVSNGPLQRTFEFDFCLAEEEHLQLVDQALDKLIANGELSLQSIDTFIMRAGRGDTARRYREGLASYLYGVLNREGHDDRARSTTAAGVPLYEQRYNSAVSALGAFDRPPAEAICGLVALHYNQFDLGVRKTRSHRVCDVAARFRSMIAGSSFVSASLIDRTHGSFDEALSDSVTEDVLTIGAMALDGSEKSSITDVLASLQELRPADQFKVRLIASEILLAAGDHAAARKQSEALRHSPDSDAWYAGFRARMQKVAL